MLIIKLAVNKLLSDSQLGFRKTQKYNFATFSVMDEWTEASDDGIQIDTVYLDFRKALESVPH